MSVRLEPIFPQPSVTEITTSDTPQDDSTACLRRQGRSRHDPNVPRERGSVAYHAETRPLPSGLVTFAMTDVEGSTQLLRRLGDAYRGVLYRHRALLRAAWAAHGGIELSISGDGGMVAFSDASAAVAAVVAAQSALEAEEWAMTNSCASRMGVHSGVATPHDGEYFASCDTPDGTCRHRRPRRPDRGVGAVGRAGRPCRRRQAPPPRTLSST